MMNCWVLVKIPSAQIHRAAKRPGVADRWIPLDGGMSGYDTESLTVEYSG